MYKQRDRVIANVLLLSVLGLVTVNFIRTNSVNNKNNQIIEYSILPEDLELPENKEVSNIIDNKDLYFENNVKRRVRLIKRENYD